MDINMRKIIKENKLITCAVVFIVLSACVVISLLLDVPGEQDIYISKLTNSDFLEASYSEYLTKNRYSGELSDKEIYVDYENAVSDDSDFLITDSGIETSDSGTVTFSFKCDYAGFYSLYLEYLPLDGTTSSIERKILLDGNILYKGLEQIIFNRQYDNTAGGDIKIKYGNEIRPLSTEVYNWNTAYVSDSLRRIENPFIFYLSEGEHTLSFTAIKEPVKLRNIIFRAYEIIPDYEQYKATYSNAPVYSGEAVVYQAERVTETTQAVYKSSQSIGNKTDYDDPDTVPFHAYMTRLNTLGGNTWRAPGEQVEWEILVPEDGLYAISFRAKQNEKHGVTSFKKLTVNGTTPFSEAEKLGFMYSADFIEYKLTINNEPALIYLNKGINTLSLENVVGDYAKALTTIENSLTKLNSLYRKTIQITGLVPDKFIDYEIEKKVPEFTAILKEQVELLSEIVDELVIISGEKGENTALVEIMANQARKLSEYPEDVIIQLDMFKNNISALGTWIINISEMPFEIDSFTIYSPEKQYVPQYTKWPLRFAYSILRFSATFFIDDTMISEENMHDALRVWVPSGRDQAQILKELVDDSFVPQYETPVAIQLIPLDVVLPATLSGTGPDVVIDMPQANVINFAIRNALVDFTQLDGYNDIAEIFYPSALDTVTYLGGVYGLPERQWFPMMYCRDDILNELGIETPRTWQDFESAIMVLSMYNYDVYIPENKFFNTLLYQYGGDYYLGEGDDYGISSGLYSEESMLAFEQLTSYFTSYRLPVRVDFPNRFRTGEIPLGIADYTLYNTLELFAPEIRGVWSFHTVPGVLNESGEINNTVITVTNQTVILHSGKRTDEAWTFVKWWLGADVQTVYARQFEAIMGTSGRYATANTDVLKQLPWTGAASYELLKQFERTVGIPEIPGGYMTDRMVEYAYKSVVTGTSAMSPRQALYLKIEEIDRELTKKRLEFGLSTVSADK